ncbi:hypothetical protein [Scatolibacter rhodanostii]|uniref:hypothetical protein n=1 Tax=Scatolibacter rhodanostii TaxID=2014781 RepID=UPI000C08B382|nr:hypothetical protein [Scatolibacter rhodanostii]
MKKDKDSIIACIAFCILCCLFLFPLFIIHITDTRPTVKIVTGIFVLLLTILMTIQIVNCRNTNLKTQICVLEEQLSEKHHTQLALYEIQQQLREIDNNVNKLYNPLSVAGFSERVEEETKAQRKKREILLTTS